MKRKVTQYTDEGAEEFKRLIVGTDWTETFRGVDDYNPTLLVNALNEVLSKYTKKCFKTVTIVTKSSDSLWITRKIRQEIKKRKYIFKKHGRNVAWKSKNGPLTECCLLYTSPSPRD